MQNVGDWFWCPRCGTITKCFDDEVVEAPMIVKRSKDLLYNVGESVRLSDEDLGLRRNLEECTAIPGKRICK
jgi:hypothetical protein